MNFSLLRLGSNVKDSVRKTYLKKDFLPVSVCIERSTCWYPRKTDITFICCALFPQSDISMTFNTSHHKAVTRKYNRCLMPWRSTGSRQMFFYLEKGIFFSSAATTK